MSNPYDKLAAIIDGQHDPVLYDPENPYRGIAWLWNGDAFGHEKISRRANAPTGTLSLVILRHYFMQGILQLQAGMHQCISTTIHEKKM